MSESTDLFNAAYKAEHSAARRLAAERGIGTDLALRIILEQAAGSAGLAQLLSERGARQSGQAARQAARGEHRAAALAVRKLRHDGPATAWRAWFDGSAHPNPGRCGIGALLTGPDGARVEIVRSAGYGNSSEAEYQALIAVLQAALEHGAIGLTVYGDSQVVINDVNGVGKSALSLNAYRLQARSLMAALGPVVVRWLPRHKNGAADALSQRAVAELP